MDEIIGFKDLKVGQKVKVKGKIQEDQSFLAIEIKFKSADGKISLEGIIQNIDSEKRIIRIFNHDFKVLDNAILKDNDSNETTLTAFKKGDLAKAKGVDSNTDTFEINKLKQIENLGFNIDEIQGKIETIDTEKKIIQISPFTITLTQKTIIEGF